MIERDRPPARSASNGAIGTLLRCACGHGIGAHTRAGCHAGGEVPCACRITDVDVLERAVARAALELRLAMPATIRRRG